MAERTNQLTHFPPGASNRGCSHWPRREKSLSAHSALRLQSGTDRRDQAKLGPRFVLHGDEIGT
jgi:hypothetical protein